MLFPDESLRLTSGRGNNRRSGKVYATPSSIIQCCAKRGVIVLTKQSIVPAVPMRSGRKSLMRSTMTKFLCFAVGPLNRLNKQPHRNLFGVIDSPSLFRTSRIMTHRSMIRVPPALSIGAHGCAWNFTPFHHSSFR